MAESAGGTLFTWQEHYDGPDLPASRASFDDGLAALASGWSPLRRGRVRERYVDGPR